MDGDARLRWGRFVNPELEASYAVNRLEIEARTARIVWCGFAVISMVSMALDFSRLAGADLTRAAAARLLSLAAYAAAVWYAPRAVTLRHLGWTQTLVAGVCLATFTVIALAYFNGTGSSDYRTALPILATAWIATHPEPAQCRRYLPAVACTCLGILAWATQVNLQHAIRDTALLCAMGGIGVFVNAALHSRARELYAATQRAVRAEAALRHRLELEAAATQRALRTRDAEWHAIVDNGPIVVLLVDESGLVLFSSDTAKGLGLAEGAQLLDWIHGAAATELGTLDAVFREARTCEFHISAGEGDQERTFTCQIAPVGPQPRPECATVVGVETTQSQRLAAQLFRAQKQQTIGSFANALAHDFNNLLTVILGSAEQLRHAVGLSDNDRENVQDIAEAAAVAGGLTQQLLVFNRHKPSRSASTDINDQLGSLLGLLSRLVGLRIRVEICLAPNLPMVAGSSTFVEQVIMNLVVNARDAMPHGGTVNLTTRAVEDGVELTVTDTGSGMRADVKNRIFEPFFTTKGEAKGTGLGLAIVKGVLDDLGGNISVDSELGTGTKFRLWFPAAARSSEIRALHTPINRSTPAYEILLIEALDSVRRVAGVMLEQAGHHVHVARNMQEAISLAHANPGLDLVVVDAQLPDASGMEVARALNDLQPRLRILYMSGFTQDTTFLEEMERQALEFIEKPFTSRKLLRAIERVMNPAVPESGERGHPSPWEETDKSVFGAA
jgi:signal transduction histidine kinase/CheY-like chemotaxis protein